MKTLANIKKDMDFNKDLSSLVEVLKNIAVAQYRSLEQSYKAFDKLLFAVDDFFNVLDIESINHPFVKPREKRQMIVAVTSDRGLLGGLNIAAINTALKELEKIPGKLVVIGERGKAYAQELGVSLTSFSGITEEERFSQAMQLRDYVINAFFDESFGYLKTVYPRPISFTVQRIETLSILPFAPSQEHPSAKYLTRHDLIFESRPRDILEYLIYTWIGQKFYEVFGLSHMAEFAARFVHLEECSQKLKDINKKLRLQYFRIRHELVDRDMRELSAARLLYGNKQ